MSDIYKKDKGGNFREIRSTRAAKDAGIENIGDFFMDTFMTEMDDLCKTPEEDLVADSANDEQNELYPVGFKPYNDTWRYEPVTSDYFASKMLGEPFTKLQQETVDIICGKDPFQFTDPNYEEIDDMWGKRSGKDSTIAKAVANQGYKLACLFNPQEFLGMGLGSTIDIVNVASTSNQAKKVFFKYLTAFIKLAKDPATKRSWFATRNFWWDVGKQKFVYMDLRQKDGNIKQDNIDFGRGICCHSLTSDRFTAEGLNIILAIMDEIGAMRVDNVFGSDERMIGQYDSLSATVRATSTNGMGKMLCISYKYARNCPMSLLVKRNKSDPKKFVRVYSVYDVRTDTPEEKLRSSFASEYTKDPEKAAMMYECKDPKTDKDNLYSNIFILNSACDVKNEFTINPIRGGVVTVNNIYDGADNLLEKWFKGDDDLFYTAHLDLAKGQVWKKHDAAALALGHLQEMRVTYDDLWKKTYLREYGIDLSENEGQLRMGVVMDLVVQIICKTEDKEVRLSDVRRFLIDLQEKRGFQIFKATIDGWMSVEMLQELNHAGIEAELLSIDKNPSAHHTQKDFLQQGLYKTYKMPIWHRETRELIEKNNKVDHPELSTDRFEEEGYEHGSKDVTDSTAGVCFNLSSEIGSEGGNLLLG